jgi:hypothetical protein
MTRQDTASLQSRFEQLRQQHKLQKAQIQTRSDQLELSRNRELLEKAADYTVDAIVKGTADLQLEIGAAVANLEEKLSSEAEKLEDLVKAIAVADQELGELQKVRIAADALFILQQESKDHLAKLEEDHLDRSKVIEKDQLEKRRDWEKAASEFETQQSEQASQSKKNREQEEADFAYRLERGRAQDTDRQNDAERKLERELAERKASLEKDWKERLAKLDLNEAKYQENKTKVEAFPTQLEEAIQKARAEGIREATSEAKIKSDLAEKEWESSKQGFELQLEALTASLTTGDTEIFELQTQLQKTLEQAQNLAGRAFKGGEA